MVNERIQYPLELTVVENELTIWIPQPQFIQANYEQLKANNTLTPFPFWAKIWASSIALLRFLKANPSWVINKQVVEMGAGIGIPSFFIAKYAKEIVISDHAMEAVALLKKNIDFLQIQNAKAVLFDWNHYTTLIEADLLLLSDINYAPNEFTALMHLIESYLLKGTKIIIATPHRIMGSSFVITLQPYIVTQLEYHILKNNEEIPISIYALSN